MPQVVDFKVGRIGIEPITNGLRVSGSSFFSLLLSTACATIFCITYQLNPLFSLNRSEYFASLYKG